MDKLKLIQKIKKLAESGSAGEKLNAQQMLNKLMEKYNIRSEDLETEIIKSFDFQVKNKTEKKLLSQIAYSVYGNINDNRKIYSYVYIKNKIAIECTDAEFLEIEAKFEFYKKEYYKQLDLFYGAFIEANDIFPEPELMKKSEENKKPLSDEDLKMIRMSFGIEKSNYLKQLNF